MEDNKNKTKVDLMYDDLFEQGYLEKDRDTFNKFFYAPGEQGYKNRKALYDDLHEQGYLESPTYEDFAKGIGLHAVGNASSTSSQEPKQNSPVIQDTGVVGGVAGGITPGSYAQEFAAKNQGFGGEHPGRTDLVESLNKYGESLKTAPTTTVEKPQGNVASTSMDGGGASSSWSDGQSVTTSDGKKLRMARQEELYVDDKGNPALGYSKEDAQDIERSELYYPLMRNDSINVGNTEAFRKGWLTAPQYEKNRKYNEAQAAGYKAQGEKFKNLTDQQLVQAMREEEKKLDGSTSPEALQASMNVTYIETLMAAREWGLGDVAGLNANPHMVDYHMARDYYNKNGLVDKYEKNMLTGRDDNPLLIRGWELIEEQYAKDEAEGNHHKSSYYRNLPFHDPKFAEEFGAYITARIKATGERWNDAVKDAIDDFEAAAEEDRVGKKHSEEYLGSANREQVDQLSSDINSAMEKRRAELDKKYDDRPWISRAGGGFGDDVQDTSRGVAYLSDPEYGNYLWAGRALNDAKKIIAAFDANKLDDGLVGFFSGAVRGMVDSIGDISTWDGGISDLLSAQRLNSALEKSKKGKPLSNSEKALLEATSLKIATAAIFKEVGKGYKAGKVTGESLPFMVEMALNPLSKSGNAIAKGLAKYAKKHFGKYLEKMVLKLGRSSAGKIASKIIGSGATKKAGKVAARVVGDIAAAGGMSATSGVGHSLANTIGYHSGDVQYQQGAGGKTHFGGVMGGDDWVTATLKGFTATTIENASEMWGEYFKPITNFLSSVGGKTLEKMHLGRVNKWLSDLNSTEMARLVGDFRKQTKWDGSIAEYFEEVAGNIANALTVKDMNFALTDKNGKFSLKEEHSVFNAQDNLDTFLGVSLMSGAMSTAKIVGYKTPTYRAKQDVKRYGDMAKRIFGSRGNDWSTIASLIQDNSEEARKQLVVDLMQSGKYSKREKQIALQYAGAVYKSMGMDLGESKQKRSAGDQEASDAYGRGYNMANLENISETSGVYNQLRAQMEQDYGSELMQRMDNEPGLVYNWVRAGAVSGEDAQKVLNYLNAKMAYDGAMDRLNDDDAAAKAAAEAHVDETIHTEENGGDGQIHPVALKGREGDFFVVSGNVATDNEGNVDVNASDTDIVVVDSEGKRIMTHAKDIAQVGDAIDPEAAKADAVAKIDGATQEVINEEDGISEEESGENGEVIDDETQVESTTPETTTTGTDATQAPLPVEEYNQDDLVTVEVDGQQVDGIISNGLDSDGNITIHFEEPINGRQNWQMTPEQLNQVAVSYTSRDGVKIDRSSEVGSKKEEVTETPQPQQQQAPGAPVQEQAPVSGESEEPLQQPAANGELDVQTGETPQTPNAPVAEAPQQAPVQPSLPVGEDGNADFSNATPQEAHDYIYNDPELDEGEANQAVKNKLKGAQNRLDQAQAALDQAQAIPAPNMEDYGEDTAGYKRAKRERNEAIAQAQAAVDAAQRDVDLWNGVQAQHMMNRAAANAAANREENPAAPAQTQPTAETTEGTQEASAPQPNEENGPVASTTPNSEEQSGENKETPSTPEATEEETTTADERIEKARIARIIERAEELAAKCGIPVRICKSEDEIPARYKKAFETAKGKGKKRSFVNGFFFHKKTANGELNEIVLYIPDIAANGGMWRLERTFLHEAVAHGGLRALFENAQDGIQTFNDLCDKVWNEVMPSGEKRDKRDYVLKNKYGAERYEEIKKQYRKEGKSLDDLMTDALKREAADEYMAHLAEDGTDKTRLEKVIQAVREALRKIKLIDKKFNDMDIVDLLAASRRNLTEMDKQILNQDVADELDRLALAGEDNGGSTLMSTTSIMEGGGLEVSREVVDKDGKVTKEPLVDEEGNLVAMYNGKEYSVKNPITAADLKEGDVEGNEATVLQMLINDARAAKNISKKQADKIYQNYADMINLFLKCGSAENGGADTVMENWEWLGDTVFRAVAANGDAQYSYSMDITKVCKKNEAVIKSISALQLREGRGATPSEIVEIYRDTHVEGYQVPCPVCYVFTRYIRNGKYASAAITGMEEYGEHLPGGKNPWTLKQWRDELNRLDRTMNPDSKQKCTDAEKEQAKRFKKQLDEANDITVYYEDRVNALSFLLTSKLTSEARKKEILEELRIIDAQYKAAVNIIARQSLTNWIKTFAIQEKEGKWTMREDAKKPEDMDDFRKNALDLRLTSNTILNYPAIQRLRKSGGSAAGKEISFESDNRLGEVVSGLGINKSNLNTYSNVYEEVLKAPNEKERKKLRKKATERFQAASEYAQQQTLRGGQRMWSWSDNIERLSPDIAINIMQLQLLGGAMQTYSKQLEGIKLAAQMGAYVNGSLMAKDNGWEEVKDSECYERDGELWLKKDKYDVVNEPRVGKRPRKRKRIIAAKDAHVYQAEDGKKYVLVYDDVVGVDPFGNEHDGQRKKGLFQLNKELDRAGNILVGMNDLHVRAAMADPAVFFIIPWHASGAHNHILNEMLEILGQRMTDRLDYTAMQEEKNMLERNKDTKKLPEVTKRLRDLWEEGRQWAKQYKWKSGMEVDSNGDLITESQYMYRALRGLIFDGSIFEAMPTEEQYQEAVEIVTNMQATVDELNARNEAWKAKSPEYKKSPEGKAEKKEIDDARTKANKAYKPAVHTIELHDGLIDWRDSSVNAEDAEWQAQHPKRINVEEARRIIEADEFLKQVYDRVSKTPGQKMTSGDNTYIYPYEYWQETDAKGKPADIKDADINGKRYVEYCRRMGYKPKFSGNWKTADVEKQNQGNFVHDPGYWKLLIDRRMYDRNGKYQWLDPVDSDNFETSLVDPRDTHKEFHVTVVADDKAADEIAQKVFERLSTRTESGFAAADYNKPLKKIMDEYDAALAAGVQNGKIKLTAAEESMLERMKAATVEESEEADDSGVMFSTSPTFYSNAERAVENIKQNKATAEQWKAMLTKAGGIKAGEDKWMGLSTWLDENKGKSLTKDEVLQFVRDNGIQMEETHYKEGLSESQQAELDKLQQEFDEIANTPEEVYKQASKRFADYVGEMEKKYGEDYLDKMTYSEKRIYSRFAREQEEADPVFNDVNEIALREMISRYGDDFDLAFTVVDGKLIPQADPFDEEDFSGYTNYFLGEGDNTINSTRLNYTTGGLENKREIAFVLPDVYPYQIDDEVHFGPENEGKAVMWVRFGETTDADGKRVLVIDEIQSNRHQDAREKGYFDGAKIKALDEQREAWSNEKTELVKEILHKQGYSHWSEENREFPFVPDVTEKAENGRLGTKEQMEKVKELNKKIDDSFVTARKLRDAIPWAPFEKNWHEVAMKRMLRLAAEEGFDKVAWTTGEQQAERYNLGRMYDSIEREDNPSIDGKRFVLSGRNMDTFLVNKEGIIEDSSFSEFNGKPLSDVVGKDLAERMMNLENGDMLEGEDLRIGGEGMKGFYDQMLPRFMDKYGKRWGVKTGTVELPNVEETGRTMHSVDVTPEMKESVMQGQPLFSVSDVNEAMQEAEVDGVPAYEANNLRFSVLDPERDADLIAELDGQEYVTVYRTMAKVNGEYYPPMDSRDHDNPEKLRNPEKLGQYTQSEERPDLAYAEEYIDKKTGKKETRWKFNLRKSNGKSVDGVAYNPYMHTSDSALNDQFSEAQDRDDLVVVECRVPVSELDPNSYHAEKALDPVGWKPWKAGPIVSKMTGKRNLLLSRWVKPVKELSWSEVADKVSKQLGDQFDVLPSNTFSKGLRAELEKRGYKFIETDNKGIIKEGLYKGVTWSDRYYDIHPELDKRSNKKAKRAKVAEAKARNAEAVRFSTSEAVATLKDDERVYNDLLGKVFSGVSNETRRGIVETAMRDMGNDFGAATESWLMGLADNGKFAQVSEEDWRKVKDALSNTLRDNGVDGTMTDNEARYVLWKAGQIEDGVFSMAEDIVMQDRLLPGERAEGRGESGVRFSTSESEESGVRFSTSESEENGVRFSVTPRDRAIARDQYERWMKNWRIQFTEAFQDSMIGLKKLMQAIMGDEYGYIEDIPMYENPYIAENLMSPTTAAEQHVFDHDYMQPILKEIANLCKGKRREREQAREDLTNYLMAKHGLERNQVLADRDAQETAQAGGNYQDAYAENRERDYSGLTALTGEDDVHAAEAKAQQLVAAYEAQHDTTELWNKINAATKKTLEKQYKSGMLSYAEYQRISGMFDYYVPLRGWEETTSDQVYGYLTSKAGPFLGGSIAKRAGGRTSKAEDPIANIAQMGDDSIRTGNRNLMKQMFLNFVQNHPSDLVSVSDLWLKYDDVTDEWVPVFANIKPKDSADVVEQKIQDFEQQMQELAEQEPDKYKHGRETANIPYRVVPGMEKEHQVLVKRNGQTWVLTINGNPRAAQALNGLTNPDVSTGTWADYIFKTEDAVNRALSAMMTTYSPNFIVSNFARDTAYVNTMVWAKENKNYALAFHANHAKLNPAYMRFLLGRWENGTLDESKPYQKYFKEFMLNGGETGYAMAQDLDNYKKKINKELGIPNGNYAVTKAVRRVVSAATPEAAKKAGRILADQYELLGRAIENSARFAAFVTSREMGRDVKRSAYDAKEISVNFNKKGSGGKMFLRPGQTFVGNVASLVAALTRAFYTFFNAGVQGMTNVGRNLKRHPYKSSAGIASLLTMGIMQPMLAAMMGAGDGDDDDKNAYYNLPPYVRRSNLCIYLPGWIAEKTKNTTVDKYMQGTWLCIPLPVEYRAIFGFGELMYSAISGNERYPDKWELAKETTAQFSQLLPVDFLEGGGGFSAFIPTSLKPMWEIHNNVGWSGAPIYKDNEWNKNDPEYTKAFSNTSEWLVDFTEWLNAKTLRNPEDEVGFLNWNPAKIEYFVKGYTGGVYSSIMEIMRAAQTAFGDREFEWRNVPLANRILKQSDERMESRNLMNEFYNLKEEYDKTKKDIDKYQKADNTDYFDYAEKLSFLNYSDRYKRYLIMDEYMDELNGLSKDLKDAKELGLPEEEIAKAERDYMAKLHQMIDDIHKFEDTGNPPSFIPTLKRVDKSRDPKLIYSKHRLAEDIMNDNLLKSTIKRAKKEGNIGLQKALEGVSRSISELKKQLGYEGVDVDEIMDSIRQLRDGALRSFGIIGGEEEAPEPEEQWTEEPEEDFGDEVEEPEMIEEPIEEPYPDDEDDDEDYI